MKKLYFFGSVFFLALLLNTLTAKSQSNIWNDIKEKDIPRNDEMRTVHPKKYRTLELKIPELKLLLSKAPMEFTEEAKKSPVILSIPMPDGNFSRFAIVESPMQESNLSAKYPEIKNYSGYCVDNPLTRIYFGWTYLGFHAIIFPSDKEQPIQIDQYFKNNNKYYISYSLSDRLQFPFNEEDFLDHTTIEPTNNAYAAKAKVGNCLGDTLRTYKLAVSCTGEYAVRACQGIALSKANVLSAINTAVTRVSGIYQNEVSIRFTLVNKMDTIIFLNPATDPYTTNGNATAAMAESQKVIDSLILDANYNLGHLFITGNGGVVTQAGVVCITGKKAMAVTGRANPLSDTFYVGYVAHEVGHQFGANHTWNSATHNCPAGQRRAATAVEPGSGVTIMSYQGLCGAVNNLEPHLLNLPYFHAVSLDEIAAYAKGTANACATKTATGNDIPVVDAGQDVSVPVSTPFTLTGSATDNHALVYSWEEVDAGAASSDWNSGNAPFFRSFAPSAGGNTRTFPKPGPAVKGETLPSTAQTLNFRLTARDNRVGGGATCSENVTVTIVAGTAFRVTSQAAATAWVANGSNTGTITWDRGNTHNAPISCDSVQIYFSADSGLTFPTFLRNAPNSGTADILIPSIATTKGKIMVKGKGKAFFSTNTGLITITICATPSVSIKASDTSICVGKKVKFTVISAANLTATPVYQWKKNNANVGSGGTEYIDSTLANGDSVWVVVSSNAACAITGVASNKIKIKSRAKTLIAIACPIALPKAAAPLYCPGDTFRVTATPAGGTWVSYTNAATVNSTGLVTVINGGGTATITYTIFDSACGYNSATCTVPIAKKERIPSIAYAAGTANPQIGAGGSGNFCNNKTFTLVGTPTGGVWSSSNVSVFTVSNTGTVNTIGLGTGTLTYTVGSGRCQNSRSITGTVVGCASRGIALGSESVTENEITVNMYPNPANTFINLTIDKLVGSGSIIISDLYGKQIKSQTLSIGNNFVDIAALSKGFYLVNIVTKNAKTTKKLLVE